MTWNVPSARWMVLAVPVSPVTDGAVLVSTGGQNFAHVPVQVLVPGVVSELSVYTVASGFCGGKAVDDAATSPSTDVNLAVPGLGPPWGATSYQTPSAMLSSRYWPLVSPALAPGARSAKYWYTGQPA